MNNIKFLQAGGFPLDLNVLDQMQTAYKLFNGLGSIAGELTILQGCTITGSTVSNGIVYINGELLEFRGGGLAPNVVIVQEAESKVFENGISQEVHYTRYATFGTAAVSWPWAVFKRIDPIMQLMQRLNTLEKKTAVFQAGGGMVLWNKPANQIPQGWQEVIDWRGRIPVGFDSTQPEFNLMGKTEGAKNKTLSISEMPSHTHGYNDIYHSEYDGNIPVGGRGSGETDFDNRGYEIARTTQSSGSGQPFSILNPYRVVMFIEYIG